MGSCSARRARGPQTCRLHIALHLTAEGFPVCGAQAGWSSWFWQAERCLPESLPASCPHSRSCAVVRVCLLLPPAWPEAEWETRPLSAAFYSLYSAVIFSIASTSTLHCYFGNLCFPVRQNHREFRNGNYIYPVFAAFHWVYLQFMPVFWSDFHTGSWSGPKLSRRNRPGHTMLLYIWMLVLNGICRIP